MENKEPKTLQVLNSTLQNISVGMEIKESAKPTITANYIALQELRRNDAKAFNSLMNSENLQTTLLTICTNSLVGGVLNKDFWIVNYKGKVVETKTGQFWKTLAMLFSINPISQINVQVFKKGDKYKFAGYPTKLVDYQPNLEVNGNKLDNIIGAYGEVIYQNGLYETRYITREEILDLKSKSPSGNSEYSPWNNWAAKMVESKVLRELVLRNVSLDQQKINQYGYKALIADEAPLSSVDNNLINVDDYEEEAPKETLTTKAADEVEEVVNATREENNDDEEVVVLEREII